MIIYKALPAALNYRKCNQLLGSFFKNYKNSEMPIIGVDPNENQKKFMNCIKNRKNAAFSLGAESFYMLKNSKSFPKQWVM